MGLDLPTMDAVNARPHAEPKPRPSILERADRRKKLKAASEKMRKDVRGRDCQQCQSCHVTVFVHANNPLQQAQVHHIQFRSHGGKNEMKNLITVCAECHAKIHAHEIEVKGKNANDVRFIRQPRATRFKA